MKSIEFAAARYRLNRETGESLRALAEALLSEGHDEAVSLAALDDLSMAEAGPVFERLRHDLDEPIPSLDDSVNIVIAAILGEIADGSVAPEAGLQRLMDDVYRPFVDAETRAGDYEFVGESRNLQQLVGASWSYNELRDRPTDYRSTDSSATPPYRCLMPRSEASQRTGSRHTTRLEAAVAVEHCVSGEAATRVGADE